MKELYLKTRSHWRRWLSSNHNKSNGIWLVFYKKSSAMPTLSYDDAVEEAICFGWVDSIIRKLDELRFARKMTPRTDGSKWSATNIKRCNRLIMLGLMTKEGLKKIEAARKAGLYKPAIPPEISLVPPKELEQALAKNIKAQVYFKQLAPSYRKQFISWVNTARKAETRAKRVAESINLLQQGKKLGLK